MRKKDKPNHLESQDASAKKSGYVRLYRSMRYDPLWMKKRILSQWEAFEYLYMEASGTERIITYKRREFKLKRGQLITSERDLAKRWKWTRGSVRNFLRKLEMRNTIAIKTFKIRPPSTLITILKYNALNPDNSIPEV